MKLNVIYNEDGLTGMDRIPDQSINMILCDPPYGITKNKWDRKLPLNTLWAQYGRISKGNSAIVMFASHPFTAELVISNAGLFRYSLIWHKTNAVGFLNAKKMPLRSHEDILVFYKKPPVYNPQKTSGHERKVAKRNTFSENYGKQTGSSYDSTERYPTSVLTFAKDPAGLKAHPTQKPVPLFEYLIKTYTHPGDVVLDNCMGSGTTAVACINTGRYYIGFEKDEQYWKISQERIENTFKNALQDIY
jgi:DNA modification methylase